MLPCLTMRQKAAVSHKVLGEQGHLPSPGLWASCLWPEVTAGLFQPLTSEAALKQQSVAQTPQSFLPCGVVCGMCGRSAQPCRLSLVTGQFLPATTVAVISFCLALHWVIYTLPPTLGCRPSHQSSVFPLPQLLAWLLWVQTGLLGRQRCPEGGWEAGDPSWVQKAPRAAWLRCCRTPSAVSVSLPSAQFGSHAPLQLAEGHTLMNSPQHQTQQG